MGKEILFSVIIPVTYKTYRAVGFGRMKSLVCFVSYALHGVWKYRGVKP